MDPPGHLLHVVGIHQERVVLELGGGPRVLREDQDAVPLQARRAVLLGHKVHAVLQGRHQGDGRRPVVGHELGPLPAAVLVVDRHPPTPGVLSLDLAHDPLDLALHPVVLGNVLPARHHELDQRHLPPQLGIALQGQAEAVELVGNALGVVEPVHSQHDLLSRELGPEPGHPLRDGVAGGLLRELTEVDGDGEDADPHHAIVETRVDDPAFALHRGVGDQVVDALQEVLPVPRRLEAEEVVGQESPEDLEPPGEIHEDVHGGERDVEEEAETLLHPLFPEIPGRGHEVIVVHPDDVVLGGHVPQGAGELPVHRLIDLPEPGVEVALGGEVVEEGPDHLVRESQVEVVLLVGGEGHPPHLVAGVGGGLLQEPLQVRHGALLRSGPADPHALAAAEHRLQGSHQTPRARLQTPVAGTLPGQDDREPVGGDDEALLFFLALGAHGDGVECTWTVRVGKAKSISSISKRR